MKTWIAVVKLESPDNQSIYEVTDALASLGDAPTGYTYTWELFEVSKERPHHGTEKDIQI